MGDKIEVILLENVEGLGEAGDLVFVSQGQARNSLFPEGLAALADEGVKQEKEDEDARQAAADEAMMTELQAKASILDNTELTIEAEVKDGNEIYGSVGQSEICRELKSQAGLACKPRDITMTVPITTLGSDDVLVSLGEGIEFNVRVTVLAAAGSGSVEDNEE
jgi:large subunit ribosomal protein L9